MDKSLFYAMLSILLIPISQAKETVQFETIEGCVLVIDKSMDGDSFRIKSPENDEYVVRLYGVDSIETNADENYMQKRLKEQALYFGIQGKDNQFKHTLKLGKQATEITKVALKKPFTIKTRYVSAMGQQDRIYAYVITSEGEDLGELLVQAGFARVFGKSDPLPESKSPYEYLDQLKVLEMISIRNGVGAWAVTDWEELMSERKLYQQMTSKPLK